MKEIIFDLTTFFFTLVLLLAWTLPVNAQSANQPGDATPYKFQSGIPTPEGQIAAPAVTTADVTSAPEAAPVPAAAPIITIWYEQSLKFGQIGNPQAEINILGSVTDPDGPVQSLTYRLNGGSAVALELGPNSTRLADPGDFNAALNRSSLLNGSNTIVFTVTGNQGEKISKTVTFNYTSGRTWPLPYSTNWASAASIFDQAQVVDGLWQISSAGIRPIQIGYDRLIAIGDVSWQDFEVLVPITVRAFYPNPSNTSDAGGIGVIARWQGHTGAGQPADGWTRIGAYGYYSNRLSSLALRLDGSNPLTQDFAFQLNRTYMMKLRVETTSQGGRYSLKVWGQGDPEPSWGSSQFSNLVNVVDTTDELTSGSVLLVAHRADATFGNVTVCPLNVNYPLAVSTIGSGSVTPQPNKASFQCGEGVTLTAQPAPGWTFSGWSGDVSGGSATISLNITRPYNVTANFVPGQPVDRPNKTYLPNLLH